MSEAVLVSVNKREGEDTPRTARLWPAWVVLAPQVVAIALSVTPSIGKAGRFGFMMLGPWLFVAAVHRLAVGGQSPDLLGTARLPRHRELGRARLFQVFT